MNTKKFTDAQVIEMRNMARETKNFNTRHWTRETGATRSAITQAIKGVTYSHLPDPVDPETLNPSVVRKSYNISLTDIHELIKLRKEDPIRWSFTALANYANEKHGTNYYPIGIKRMLEKHCSDLPVTPKKVRIEKPKRKGAAMSKQSYGQSVQPTPALPAPQDEQPKTPDTQVVQDNRVWEPIPKYPRHSSRKIMHQEAPAVKSRFEDGPVDIDETVQVRYKRQRLYGMKVIDISTPIGRKLLARRILVDRARAGIKDIQPLDFE